MGLKVVLWEKQPRSDGTCAIRIYLNRDKHKYYGLKLYCQPREFDYKAGRVKRTRYNWQSINSSIAIAYNRFEQIMLENENIGVDEIVNIYDFGGRGIKNEYSFHSFVQMFMKECKEGKVKRSIARQKNYKSAYNMLKEFNPNLNFNHINKDFYNSLVAWMRNEKHFKKNTIGHRINVLKAFLNEADDRGIYKDGEQKRKYFQGPEEDSDSIYLNEKELDKIIKLNLSKHPHLQQERDRFVVATFLLCRYGDSITIQKEMIIEDWIKRDNKKKLALFFRKRSQKTNTEVIIPIKPIVKKILERNNYSLNFDTNQESNWKIKEIGSLVAKKYTPLKEKIIINGKEDYKYNFINTHTARRSGATNLHLQGVSIRTIAKLLGHKKITTTEKYIRVDALETAHIMANHPFFN